MGMGSRLFLIDDDDSLHGASPWYGDMPRRGAAGGVSLFMLVRGEYTGILAAY